MGLVASWMDVWLDLDGWVDLDGWRTIYEMVASVVALSGRLN